MKKFDFSGWATKNNLKCADGRTILKDAFIDNDGETVPLVWNHQHDDPTNVLGHALLENTDEGVRAYCSFNDTEKAQAAKKGIEHGDITALSIFANGLKQRGGDVLHGAIKEVSLVLAGANPGAYIDDISFAHGDDDDFDEAVIYSGEGLSLYHSEEKKEPEEKSEEPEEKGEKKMADEPKKEEGGDKKNGHFQG